MALPDSGKIGAIELPENQPSSMTNESTTLVSGRTYQIDDITKRYIDPTKSIVVEDNGVTMDSNDYVVQACGGFVTISEEHTIAGAITIAGYYWNTTDDFYQVLGFYSWSVERSREVLERTEFQDDNRKYIYGWRDWTISADRYVRLSSVSNEFFDTGDGVTVSFFGYINLSPFLPSSISFLDTSNSQTIIDDGDGTLSGDGSGTIDYATGYYEIVFNSAPTNGTTLTTSYDYDLIGEINKRSYIVKVYHNYSGGKGYVGYGKLITDNLNCPHDGIFNQTIEFQGHQALEGINSVET